MKYEEIVSFCAGLPVGEYRFVIDRVELELSRRLSAQLLIHLMVVDGEHKGVRLYKRIWLTRKSIILRTYFDLRYMGLPRKNRWDAALLTEFFAGKEFVGHIRMVSRHPEVILPEAELTDEELKMVSEHRSRK